MAYNSFITKVLGATAAQAKAFQRMKRSPAVVDYGSVMERAARSVEKFCKTASFDQLLAAEKIFQKNDLTIFSTSPSTRESVLEGIDNFRAGEKVYRQLMRSPMAYKEHEYLKSKMVGPDRLVPKDTMRQAIRSQISRVENYRKNVMGNEQEVAFTTARIAMLRRAEKLYDKIQRERLLPESR